MTAQASMLNGLIGEADSLLKAVLETLDIHFTQHSRKATNLGQKFENENTTYMYKIGEL